MPEPRILALPLLHSGSEWWRVHAPIAHLAAQGYPARWLLNSDPQVPAALEAADVVVLPRWSVPAIYESRFGRWLHDLLLAGKTVVAEVDDDTWSDACVPQFQLLHPEWSEAQLTANRAAHRLVLEVVDGVIVSSPALAAAVEQVTRAPVAVVPNAIDWPHWRAACAQGQRPAPGLTIGWAGGPRLAADVAPLAAAWTRIAARYPAVTFVLVGFPPDILRESVPAERLVSIGWQPLDLYPRAYHGIDIFCCPLADTPFNACKTPCKAFEAAVAGSAVVASPTVYGRVMRQATDGFVANDDVQEWEHYLAWFIDYPDSRRRVVTRWQTRVQQRHSLATEAHRWVDAWTRLWGAGRARRKVTA